MSPEKGTRRRERREKKKEIWNNDVMEMKRNTVPKRSKWFLDVMFLRVSVKITGNL